MANNLAPIVMKFGGTSLRDEDCRAHALEHIKRYHESGERIVVVVSAMGRKGEPYATDTLGWSVKKETILRSRWKSY